MTNRGEWDPLREMLGVQKRMNDLFETALARSNFDAANGIDAWTPVCDVFADGGRLVLSIELPGMEQDDIHLRIDGDELVVEGAREMDAKQPGERYHRVERAYGRFGRRFRLPSTADRGAVRATYRAGVLTVVVPEKGGSASGPIRVEIG